MSIHFSILIISSSSPTHLIIIVISITKMSNQVPLPSQQRNPAERVQVSPGTGQMRGRGDPENVACRFRGVRQRAWGKWVAELRQPGGPRLWLRTYDNAVDAALAYDTAAHRIHGANTRVNFPEGQPPENPPSTQMTLQALVNTDLGLYPPGASSSSPNTNISDPG